MDTALAWQIALDRHAFSPGVIDGKIGPKTTLATREFQRCRRLPETGTLDQATAAALETHPEMAVARYAIQEADFARIGPAPTGWLAKSKLSMLGYESLEAAIAEKFHCSKALLRSLNGGKDIAGMKAGDEIRVPGVVSWGPDRQGRRLQVNLSQKVIRVLGADGEVLALFHCSIAARKDKLPAGSARVAVIAENPTYTFDPAMWPEVKGVNRKLVIPPGPRNPVGLCWIGLSLPGYGMHGTPSPEMIGKTGSHGCFRLTNWDAVRLSKMVQVGTPVEFARQ